MCSGVVKDCNWFVFVHLLAVQVAQEDGVWDYHLDNMEVAFANTIRTTFLNYFAERFTSYEHFVIQPQQSYDQWLRNREQFQNFDKTAFLSDQSPQHWPFYSAFLETSMFSAFIDKKIISACEPSHTDACLPIFDSSIENFLNTNGIPVGPTPPQTPSTCTCKSHDLAEGDCMFYLLSNCSSFLVQLSPVMDG